MTDNKLNVNRIAVAPFWTQYVNVVPSKTAGSGVDLQLPSAELFRPRDASDQTLSEVNKHPQKQKLEAPHMCGEYRERSG